MGSIGNNTTFAEEATNVFIPAIMFILNVSSNSLAIACLLRYKFRGNSKSPRNCSDTLPEGSPTSTTEAAFHLGEKKTNCDFGPKKVRTKKFGVFHTLVSVLAILDLLGSICTGPLTFILYTKEIHILAFGGMSICYYSAFAMLFFGFTSMAMVMAMSIERLFSIKYAFYYQEKATVRKALIVVFGALIASAILCLSPVFGFGAIKAMYPYSWCFANWNARESKDMAFNYLYVALSLLVFAVTLICNVLVIRSLYKMKRKLKFRSKKKKMTRETQMIIQLLSITCIFAICWLPLVFRILVNQLGFWKSLESDRIALWLAAVNPILDPWVYILGRMSVFRLLNSKIKVLCFTEPIHSTASTMSLEKNKVIVCRPIRNT